MNTSTLFIRRELTDSKIVAIYDAVANEATRCARCNGDAKLRATLSQLPHHGVTDTSIPLPDKDGLRGRHCRPEKHRYQHHPRFSLVHGEPVFSSRRPDRASRVKRVYVEMSRYIE